MLVDADKTRTIDGYKSYLDRFGNTAVAESAKKSLGKLEYNAAILSANRLILRKRPGDGTTMAGNNPLILDTYNASGDSGGGGFLSLSGNMKNDLLDIEAVDSVTLGLQLQNGQPLFVSQLKNNDSKTVYIDTNGIAHPGDTLEISAQGPFIAIGNFIPTSAESPLRPLAIIYRNGLAVIENLPAMPIKLKVNGSYITLFPRYRSATPDAVVYNLMKTQ